MRKIINVSSDYNYYNRKLFALLKRTKSLLCLLIVVFLLLFSDKKKLKNISIIQNGYSETNTIIFKIILIISLFEILEVFSVERGLLLGG